ncbi:MAG: ACT domain-containing protein [Planctomycetota bacterium]
MSDPVDEPTNAPHRLEEALPRMRFAVEPGGFGLAGFAAPPGPDDLALLTGGGPAQLVREGGETTLLVPEDDLAAVLERHPEARLERGLRWIRFECPMAWDLVGFLALVTGRLTEAGVPLGAVCGFSRDHLFVAERYLPATRAALGELFPEVGGGR